MKFLSLVVLVVMALAVNSSPKGKKPRCFPVTTTTTTKATTTEATTTKATTTKATTPQTSTIAPSVCKATGDIIYSNGKVGKKVCLVTTALNHEAAENFCNSNGMQGLFAINNAEDLNQLQTFMFEQMRKIVGTQYASAVFIDGVRAADGKFYNNNSTNLLFSGAYPKSSSGLSYLMGYLNANSQDSSEVIIAEIGESNLAWSFCEFDVVA